MLTVLLSVVNLFSMEVILVCKDSRYKGISEVFECTYRIAGNFGGGGAIFLCILW